jgi:3-oxoacyl-(acyl-carrier-protein) synthase
MHGSSGYSDNYYSQIVREGIAAANPMLFAEGVPNGGAAQLSLMLGLKGACQTIIGTRTAGLDAMGLASARIATGAWERAIVGGGEEYSQVVHNAYKSCGLALKESPGPVRVGEGFVYGGGAVALILESKDSLEQRHGRALAKIAKSAWRKGRAQTIPAAMSSLLAQLGPAQAIISSACNTWIDRAEAIAIGKSGGGAPVWSPHGHAPELFSAGPFLGIAALYLRRNLPRTIVPPGAIDDGLRRCTGEESPISVNVVATDFTGCVAGARIEML